MAAVPTSVGLLMSAPYRGMSGQQGLGSAFVQIDDQARRTHQPLRRSEPDVRPLGFIALGFAFVSLVLAPSYFLSLLAYLPAVPAVFFGFVARGDKATRTMGNAALLLAGAAVVCATGVVLFWY